MGFDRALILESAGKTGQVALAANGVVVAEASLEGGRRRASDLALTVDRLLHEQGWRGSEVTDVVVGLGPGSYTGLRVGLASAKAFAFAVGATFHGVETFAAIVAGLPTDATRASVASDALQGKLFCRDYARVEGKWSPLGPLETLTIDDWKARMTPKTWITGPAAVEVDGAILFECTGPRPIDLINVAHDWDWAVTTDLWTAEPLYLRGSSAEEKAAATSASMK